MSNNLSRAWSQATSCHLEEIMQRKQKTKGIFNEIQCCILQKMSHLLLKNAKGHKCDSQREPWNEKKNYYKIIIHWHAHPIMSFICFRRCPVTKFNRTGSYWHFLLCFFCLVHKLCSLLFITDFDILLTTAVI